MTGPKGERRLAAKRLNALLASLPETEKGPDVRAVLVAGALNPYLACHSKIRFARREVAEMVAREKQQEFRDGLKEAYQCPFCQSWHLTSNKGFKLPSVPA